MIVYVILVTVIFAVPLSQLAAHASGSDLHSHILLVPFVAAYVLRERWRSLPPAGVPAFTFSVIAAGLGAGAGLVALAWRGSLSPNDYLAAIAVSYVGLLVAGGFYFMGRAWMAAAAFPVAFLLFLAPLPDGVVDRLERGSMVASAEAAAAFFWLAGMPLVREGTLFELSTITLLVAQECSGIRSSWVLLITAVVASNLFLTSPWRKLILIAFVVPLGILRNGFRVFVLGWLCVHVGPHIIDTAIHHRGGPIFFGLSLVPFALFVWWLRRGDAPGMGRVRSSAAGPPQAAVAEGSRTGH